MSDAIRNYTTRDTDPTFSDLNGSMTAQGNDIQSYTSTNLGAAIIVARHPPPPMTPISCVLVFGSGATTKVYTICGIAQGRGFVGKAHAGVAACPVRRGQVETDDWTASPVGIDKPKEAKAKPAKKPASKKAVKKPARKKS